MNEIKVFVIVKKSCFDLESVVYAVLVAYVGISNISQLVIIYLNQQTIQWPISTLKRNYMHVRFNNVPCDVVHTVETFNFVSSLFK